MKVGEKYYKFTILQDRPSLVTYTISHKSKTYDNSWIAYIDFKKDGTLTLKERDLNHTYFDSIIGAASNIYEQYLLRNQQGVNSIMINQIVHWDYFQELLEEQPGIMI